MAKAGTLKKSKSRRPRQKPRPASKGGSRAERKHGKSAAFPKRFGRKASPKREKKRGAALKVVAVEERRGTTAESKKRPEIISSIPPPEKPPRLLSETKSTTAALALLEKAVKLIYQKEFKKSRNELKMLVETYPGEREILARARTYLQICDREEAAQRRAPITGDQLYALGVMEHNRGQYEQAISHFRQSLHIHPGADYIYYSLAASYSMSGNTAAAVENLQKAIGLNNDNRIYARNDVDFARLLAEKEFADLVGLNPSPAGESPQP